MFRLIGDCSTGPLFALSRLLCAWKIRSYFYELVRDKLCALTLYDYFDRAWKLRTWEWRQANKRHLLADPWNCGERQEVAAVCKVLDPVFILDDCPEHATAR